MASALNTRRHAYRHACDAILVGSSVDEQVHRCSYMSVDRYILAFPVDAGRRAARWHEHLDELSTLKNKFMCTKLVRGKIVFLILKIH